MLLIKNIQFDLRFIYYHLRSIHRIPYGLVVRILAFHAGGPGSIPGVGKFFNKLIKFIDLFWMNEIHLYVFIMLFCIQYMLINNLFKYRVRPHQNDHESFFSGCFWFYLVEKINHHLKSTRFTLLAIIFLKFLKSSTKNFVFIFFF